MPCGVENTPASLTWRLLAPNDDRDSSVRENQHSQREKVLKHHQRHRVIVAVRIVLKSIDYELNDSVGTD